MLFSTTNYIARRHISFHYALPNNDYTVLYASGVLYKTVYSTAMTILLGWPSVDFEKYVSIWLLDPYSPVIYFRILRLRCRTTPCSISIFSITAPTSSREWNGFGAPGTMPCDLFNSMRTTPDDQACFGRILLGPLAMSFVQNRSLTSIIFCPCSASRASRSLVMRYSFLLLWSNNAYTVLYAYGVLYKTGKLVPACLWRGTGCLPWEMTLSLYLAGISASIRSSRCFFNTHSRYTKFYPESVEGSAVEGFILSEAEGPFRPLSSVIYLHRASSNYYQSIINKISSITELSLLNSNNNCN